MVLHPVPQHQKLSTISSRNEKNMWSVIVLAVIPNGNEIEMKFTIYVDPQFQPTYKNDRIEFNYISSLHKI
jgi:hypothetical protein